MLTNKLHSIISGYGINEDDGDWLLALLGEHEDGRLRILGAIELERKRQDSKWGGEVHDNVLTPLDWHEMISDYNGWARRMATMGSPDKARRRLIQLAALAVAQVEAIDRQTDTCHSKSVEDFHSANSTTKD